MLLTQTELGRVLMQRFLFAVGLTNTPQQYAREAGRVRCWRFGASSVRRPRIPSQGALRALSADSENTNHPAERDGGGQTRSAGREIWGDRSV